MKASELPKNPAKWPEWLKITVSLMAAIAAMVVVVGLAIMYVTFPCVFLIIVVIGMFTASAYVIMFLA